MQTIHWFKEKLFDTSEQNFDDRAIAIFHLQREKNPVYKAYISHLNIQSDKVAKLEQIPFMPIGFFKKHEIKTGDWQPQTIFKSSGTMQSGRSNHFIEDLEFYWHASRHIINDMLPEVTNRRIFGLLPNYLEQGNSSLVNMVDRFIQSGDPESGFFLKKTSKLYELLKTGKPTILFGVTYALLDFLEEFGPISTSDLIIIETGGMKGRKKELTREAYVNILKEGFIHARIVSEYGMTELMSQAYNVQGLYKFPKWAKVMIRDINDPFFVSKQGKGAANIIDLANVHSCSFIATDDLGEVHENGEFSILGRLDNSDIRGCSLLI